MTMCSKHKKEEWVMLTRKIINLVVSLMVLSSLFLGATGTTTALAATPVPPGNTPHYFGPYPNWANSPLTLPDAKVTITGNGSGATAVASVGAGGVITGMTVTDPGRNY